MKLSNNHAQSKNLPTDTHPIIHLHRNSFIGGICVGYTWIDELKYYSKEPISNARKKFQFQKDKTTSKIRAKGLDYLIEREEHYLLNRVHHPVKKFDKNLDNLSYIGQVGQYILDNLQYWYYNLKKNYDEGLYLFGGVIGFCGSPLYMIYSAGNSLCEQVSEKYDETRDKYKLIRQRLTKK